MQNTNRDNFDGYDSLADYWIKEDCLRSLDHDLYFSLGKRYYCGAGCKVCYIKDNLAKTKDLVNEIFTDDFSLQSTWFEIFDYFGSVRTNDDLYYLKYNFPNHYKWYQTHGHLFEVCITDNAIFRILDLDIKIKTLGDISISTEFLEQVGVDKVLDTLGKLYDKYGIQKIKYIDCGNPTIFKELIEFTKNHRLHNCVHHDFRTNNREILEQDYAEYQNTWVVNDNSGLMQIYRESIHLYNDRFYFSSDDASNLTIDPFHLITNGFDHSSFMTDMLTSKQYHYDSWKNRVINPKFREYYKTTLEYTVNKNFTFIPYYMYTNKSRFFYKLQELGWTMTKFGMLKTDQVIPIISKI